MTVFFEQAVPSLLPRRRPAPALVELDRQRAFELYGRDIGKRKAIYRLFRNVALHEAAHAVVHLRLGADVQFAEIVPDRHRLGRVRIAMCRWYRSPGDNDVRGALAGPVADCLSDHTDSVNDEGQDMLDALRECGRDARRLEEIWAETVVFVTMPHNWRAIVAVADALLMHGHLGVNELWAILHKVDKAALRWDRRQAHRQRQHDETLQAARFRVLDEGRALYDDALGRASEQLECLDEAD